jgi:hypothetical protein
MKKNLLFIAIILVTAASCVKDRIPPAVVVVTPTSDTLMYYWNFNDQDSANHSPTFGVHSGAYFSYYCAYIDYTTGTPLNAVTASDSGSCLRLRNPSDSIVFHMSTVGYDSITIQLAEESSSSGPSQNALYYTTDGVHYNAVGNAYSVTTTFALYNFSVANDPNAGHNAKFAFKIVPLNNNTGTSGNDRIDNITLRGVRQ